MSKCHCLESHGTKKAMRMLPPNSHCTHLVCLNMGSHALDVIYRRIRKMVTQNKNSKMQVMVLNSLSDQRNQIAKIFPFCLNVFGTKMSIFPLCLC